MNSPKRLTAALAACFLLASCATSPTPATGLQRPLPAEYASRCPPPPQAPALTGEVVPVAEALKAMYDLLEAVTDRCEDVANMIEGVVLENS